MPSDNQEILKELQVFFTKNLLQTPPEIKSRLPPILSRADVKIFVFSTSDYVIVAFLNQKEMDRILGLKERNIHPFFALIRPPNNQGPVFFRFGDRARNNYVGKMTLKDGYAFSIGKDCTLVVEELRQSVLLKPDERYEYDIELAYIATFGDEIKKENVLDFLKDTISYTFEIWRKSSGNTPA